MYIKEMNSEHRNSITQLLALDVFSTQEIHTMLVDLPKRITKVSHPKEKLYSGRKRKPSLSSSVTGPSVLQRLQLHVNM